MPSAAVPSPGRTAGRSDRRAEHAAGPGRAAAAAGAAAAGLQGSRAGPGGFLPEERQGASQAMGKRVPAAGELPGLPERSAGQHVRLGCSDGGEAPGAAAGEE